MPGVDDLHASSLLSHHPLRVNCNGVASKRAKLRARVSLSRLLFSEYLLLYLILFYLVIFIPLMPGLVSKGNFRSIVSNLLPLLIVSIAQGFVLITAGIDLSVTSVFACCSVVGGLIMTADGGLLAHSRWAVPAALMAMLLVGLGIGLINGVSITVFRMPPFIVTLSTMTFFGGVAVWLTRSRNIYQLPKLFIAIGKGSLFSIPHALLLTAVLAGIAHLILNQTVMGRWLYSVGQNTKAAIISGVPVNRTILFAYVTSGACATLATVILMGRLETASPIIGQRLLLDTIAAPVIGGVSLFGGRGKVYWIILGALFVTFMDNGLNLLGLSYFAIMMAKGGLILFAAFLDVRRTAVSLRS
jgi:ribose/xylose/arabinose/galactoside ABC-type transport system permease subunit